MPLLHKEVRVVLAQPEIPQNVGNIARTCAATGSALTLARPLGFTMSDRKLKRAGLDYWEGVEIEITDDLDTYLEERGNFFCFSTKAKRLYTEVDYSEDALLVFGSETKGLPEEYFAKWEERFVTIPMRPSCRSLNLANSVAIALYEVLRQHHFNHL
ncbi:MAG: tRNA (cytidine(34)-2'-O)-methyltransferase [Chlamydiae bacterium]|nr:tRNA (cytidine(34)-2'-O)-methyltransferase [Chlamydiota bacterium]